MATDNNTTKDYREQIRQSVLDGGEFQRLTFSQPRAGQSQWERVVLHPLMLKGARHVQFAFDAGKKHITKNFAGDELRAELDRLLDGPFERINLQSPAGDLHVRLTKKGKALVTRAKPSKPAAAPLLEHNRQKSYILPADRPDELLQGLGIMSADGKVKAAMYGKFRQINEFLRVLAQIAEPLAAQGVMSGRPIRLIDCGCGNAYLTFAAYHYLRHVLKISAVVTGVDVNVDLIANCRKLAGKLGWTDLEFHVSSIADFRLAAAPDIVVSLHACDTATDDALAGGVRWASRYILSAPCCQHELHDQLRHEVFHPLLKHGVLKERLADLLTDAFRAAILRVAGYRARVFEFISPEHTAKNVMLVAERIEGRDADRLAALEEYRRLRDFWQVQPYLDRALADLLGD